MKACHLGLDPRGVPARQQLRVPLGADRTGRDRVDPDAARTVLDGERPGQTLDRRLGGHVRNTPRNGTYGLMGGDVDDRAGDPGRQEPSHGGRASGEGDSEVELDAAQDLARRGQVVGRGIAEHGGVVDPAGERRRGLRLIGRQLGDGLIGGVAGQADEAGTGGEESGRAATELVLQRLDEPGAPRSISLGIELVVRSSG